MENNWNIHCLFVDWWNCQASRNQILRTIYILLNILHTLPISTHEFARLLNFSILHQNKYIFISAESSRHFSDVTTLASLNPNLYTFYCSEIKTQFKSKCGLSVKQCLRCASFVTNKKVYFANMNLTFPGYFYITCDRIGAGTREHFKQCIVKMHCQKDLWYFHPKI